MKNDSIDILIVEDSPTQSEKLEHLIRSKGYNVRVAMNGEMALAALAECKPNLVLSDVLMPGMDGCELCKAIKSDERWKDIPVILVTSLTDPKDIVRGLECGADNFIRKPYADSYLLARINYVLMNQELRAGKNMDVDIVLYLGGQKHFINSQRQQILDLLISTYEEAIIVNEQLLARERQVLELNMRLARYSTELEAANRLLAEKNVELEQASRAKSEFLASMSHELRTPLNAILGFSEALKDGLAGDMPDGQREYVADIHYSGAHLLSLVNDILDLAKIEAGKMELEPGLTDVDALLKNTISVVRQRASTRGIRVTVEAEPMAPILIDQRRFRQIAFNLLSNAIKFTPEGGEITVHLRRVLRPPASEITQEDQILLGLPPSRAYLEFCVIDNGIGMEESALTHLFQPFVQLDSGSTRKYDGSGLGLAIVKQLVDLHGGLLEVKTEIGCGSQFRVLLPVEQEFPSI